MASAIVEQYQDFAWEKYGSETFPPHLYDTTYWKSIFLKYQAASIFEELTRQFDIDDHPYEDELKILLTLNPHAIITTNYDCFLETIFPKYNVIIGQQVIRRKESVNIGHILKIHGCMTKPEEIVISDEDYRIFNEKQKYLTAKLLNLFHGAPCSISWLFFVRPHQRSLKWLAVMEKRL